LWVEFRDFFSVCPKGIDLQVYNGFISDLLGLNVGFYELVPNMEIADKGK